MTSQAFSESVYLSFVTILMMGKLQLIKLGAEFDLTLVQTLTLLILAKTNEMPMSHLGKLYDCDASNVTGIVDGLEQKKLVSRRAHAKDRRVKMICLEPAGRKLQAKLIKRLSETSGYLFDPLTETEQVRFAKLMEKISPDLTELT
ncbi:MAG TPA: MarR family transcriptional regulator [Candidatus Saccharimonadales bacterium]|nr:MarR family transcriptional regulator [Candidatus Saccharimonadales bacterium]